jgi:hypothetical protein
VIVVGVVVVVIPSALGSGKMRRLGRHNGKLFGLKNRQPGWENNRNKENKQKVTSAERKHE